MAPEPSERYDWIAVFGPGLILGLAVSVFLHTFHQFAYLASRAQGGRAIAAELVPIELAAVAAFGGGLALSRLVAVHRLGGPERAILWSGYVVGLLAFLPALLPVGVYVPQEGVNCGSPVAAVFGIGTDTTALKAPAACARAAGQRLATTGVALLAVAVVTGLLLAAPLLLLPHRREAPSIPPPRRSRRVSCNTLALVFAFDAVQMVLAAAVLVIPRRL